MKKKLEKVQQIQDVPVPYQDRSCTDVFCIIIGFLFTIIISILAIALFNYHNFFRANFPSDTDGRLCGIDEPAENYPYVYFVNPPLIDRRVCVQQCPKQNDTRLKCIPTQNIGCHFANTTDFQIVYYPNYENPTRSGYFCYPEDETLRQKLLQNTKLEGRQKFYKSIDTIRLCFFVSLGFCTIYLLLVQFLPKAMNYIAVLLGCLIIIGSIICILTYNTNQIGSKLILALALFTFLLVIACWIFKAKQSWYLHSIFLQHSAKVVRQRIPVLFFIPIFLLILFAFLVIVVLQFTSFWTSGNLNFYPERQIFYELEGGGPVALTVFLAIQAIWGLSFIKSAFNFCVSCQAIRWDYKQEPSFCFSFKLLLFKHLGSIIAGSFMTGFVAPFDFIFDIIKPNLAKSPDGCYSRLYRKTCLKLVNVMDLVRQDALALINITANPYCNSSRYTQYLCGRSEITNHSQLTSRIYRISAHLFLTGIMVIFALYVNGQISINALFLVGVIALFTSTLFISLHADISQALQITILLNQQLSKRDSNNGEENFNINKIPLKSEHHLSIIKQINKLKQSQMPLQKEK